MEKRADTEPVFEFEQFRLLPSRQLLMQGSNVCPLGSRAIDILVCLLEQAGQMVTKQELLKRAWPNTFVDEANLRVNVSALRKALGDGQAGRRFIVNLTGQGYSFVAPVRRLEAPAAPLSPDPVSEVKHNLPAQPVRPLGRESDIESISLQLPMRRCVTIAGPGGIGKTTLAVAVAQRLLPMYDEGVWFVDLSSLTDGQLILPSIAQVLGLSLRSGNALQSLVTFLRDKRLLLVLDNCEHVIEEAATLVENVLLETGQVRILATSRETLRVNHEWVHWIAPLALPPVGAALTAAEALTFAAVRFFTECAAVTVEGFTLQDADVATAVEVCRGLDGLPLAIELAAARIDILGLKGLAKVLHEPFLLLSEGRRSAFPRQQNLTRMLEWSYKLLTATERSILRRLSVFRGEFSLDGALQIAGGDGIESEHVYSAVLTLSAKSLITSDIHAGTPNPQYRMLHVTRTLLSHKLRETAENTAVLRRHADYIQVMLAKAEIDWEEMARPAWLEIYARRIVDARAAIDWAFSPTGDASLGVVLTAMAVPLGFQLSQIDEFRGRVERALMHSQRIRPTQPLSEMRLNMALGMFTHNTKGPSGGRTAAMDRAIEVGRRLDDPAHQAEPLISLGQAHMGAGEHLLSIEVCNEAIALGREADRPMTVLAAQRVLAQAHHFNGDHEVSAQIARRVIDHPAVKLPLTYNLTPVDRHVSMQIVLARIFWIQGRFDQADQLLEDTIVIARNDGAFSFCPTLAFCAIPIAMWNGEDAEARNLTTLLAEQAKRYTLGYWQRWADAYDVALRLRAGEQASAPSFSDSLQFETFATLSLQLLTPEAVSRAAAGASGWCSPEILRAQGEWLLEQQSAGAAVEAESLFREALETAQRQGAVAWELRAALSLARLTKSTAARELLAGIVNECRHQRRTSDLTSATALLAATSKTPRNQHDLTITRKIS
jgi:predicted ATPase/DNA-binding winged helix-turn-helix (wHTH) protein